MSNDINNRDASAGPVAVTENSSQESGESVSDTERPESETTESEKKEPQSKPSSVGNES